ncbi:HPP family protein [Streptomyces sp. MI02-7b]|uniref:HPP family protein n=1 Tax=Streptomyces sp. MI02-7b TaxID=462941 RepID=UPI0029BEB51B|nr:HPP family protein [Streptomyces sp. MI02-7b]MDX3072786.1 HPP family protein [Streptomyces sp. MI02-7b]
MATSSPPGTAQAETAQAGSVPARWWKTAEPRPARRTVVSAAVTTSVGLAVVVAAGTLLHQTVLVPPLAATAAIVTATPGSPLAQPRHVLGGHMLSCLVCFVVLALGWHGPWAAAAACGIACGLVLVLKAAHPPAMATAVMIMLTDPPAHRFVPLLAAGLALLVGVQMVSSRLRREVYPTAWW